MSVTPEKSLNTFFISSHAPSYSTQFCHPRPTGQLPINGLEKPRRLCSKKYFYQTHVTKHESHKIYNTGDSSDDLIGGPTVRKYNDKNKMKDYCKKIKCTRTNNSYSNEHDQALCAFWYLFSEYLKKMFQFYWGFLTIRCPVRRNVRLHELSCEMRGILFCMKKDFGLFFKNALCMPAKNKKKEKQNTPNRNQREKTDKKKDKKQEKEDKKQEKAEKKLEKLERKLEKEKAKREKKDKKATTNPAERRSSKQFIFKVESKVESKVASKVASKVECSSE